MRESTIINMINQCGGIQFGHFVFQSGLHSKRYISKEALTLYPRVLSILCKEIAKRIIKENILVDICAAPAIGAIPIASWIAFHLGEMENRDILSVYAEKVDGNFIFRRGYDKRLSAKAVLVTEDNLSTGASASKIFRAVNNCDGLIVGLSAIWDQGEVLTNMGDYPPFKFALINQTIETWEAENCPLCKELVPINTHLGHGSDWLKSIQGIAWIKSGGKSFADYCLNQ